MLNKITKRFYVASTPLSVSLLPLCNKTNKLV